MYNASEYPEGVPNPNYPDVNIYPTYEHGPDYTRPVFGQPFEPGPFNVLEGLGSGPYGNAPRASSPWLESLNPYTGRPIVQPQPNPYFAHWPENLGGVGEVTTTSRAKLIFGAVTVVAVIGAWYLFYMRETRAGAV